MKLLTHTLSKQKHLSNNKSLHLLKCPFSFPCGNKSYFKSPFQSFCPFQVPTRNFTESPETFPKNPTRPCTAPRVTLLQNHCCTVSSAHFVQISVSDRLSAPDKATVCILQTRVHTAPPAARCSVHCSLLVQQRRTL